MKVAFRVDASLQIGSGHVMRCLTLADALSERGADVVFVCRELCGHMSGVIANKGYRIHLLPVPMGVSANLNWNRHASWLGVPWERDAAETLASLKADRCFDWLIVDHYALDEQWQRAMRPVTAKIMVIDDLADRCHDCNILLDQNLYPSMSERYSNLLPQGCEQMLGPSYVLLRPEFTLARKKLHRHGGKVRRILIFMGGGQENVSGKVLNALELLSLTDIVVDFVAGPLAIHLGELKNRYRFMPRVTWHENVSDMAALMTNADLAIGGGGTTTWERCALCLPSLIISLASNQTAIAQAVDHHGAALFLGEQRDIDAKTIRAGLLKLLEDPCLLRNISMRCHDLVDTLGTRRVAHRLLEIQ